MIEVEPGVQVLAHCHWQSDRQNALTVIIVHGLEGSSDSTYMQGIAAKGLARGMNVVRMNQRNCGGTEGLAPDALPFRPLAGHRRGGAKSDRAGPHLPLCPGRIFHGRQPGAEIGRRVGKRRPAQFRAVAAVCPAVNLAASADALHLPGNRLYEQYFLWSLNRRLRTKARLFPGAFDTSRLRGIRSLREFDDRITAFYCGFTGADDYYDRAAAAHVMDRIAVPTFILNAANDPFIRILPETRREDPGQSEHHVHRNRRRRPLLLPGREPTAAATAAGPNPRS